MFKFHTCLYMYIACSIADLPDSRPDFCSSFAWWPASLSFIFKPSPCWVCPLPSSTLGIMTDLPGSEGSLGLLCGDGLPKSEMLGALDNVGGTEASLTEWNRKTHLPNGAHTNLHTWSLWSVFHDRSWKTVVLSWFNSSSALTLCVDVDVFAALSLSTSCYSIRGSFDLTCCVISPSTHLHTHTWAKRTELEGIKKQMSMNAASSIFCVWSQSKRAKCG